MTSFFCLWGSKFGTFVPVSLGNIIQQPHLGKTQTLSTLLLWTQHPNSPLTQQSPPHRQEDRDSGPKRTRVILLGNRSWKHSITETMKRANTCLACSRLWIQASLPKKKNEKRVKSRHVAPVPLLRSNQLREMYFYKRQKKKNVKIPQKAPSSHCQLQSLSSGNGL